MTTTKKNLTESQIRSLHTAAGRAGDYMMAVICDLALDGSIDLDDYTTLDPAEATRMRKMTQDEALALVVEAINDAAGR